MNGKSADCRAGAPPSAERRSQLLRALAFGVRMVLGGIFIAAAITKITDLAAFEDRLALHNNLPDWVVWIAARWLPWLELVTGLCLVSGYAVREAALIVLLLLILFLVHSLFLSEASECGCFLFAGLEEPFGRGWLRARDGLLAAGAVFLIIRPRREQE